MLDWHHLWPLAPALIPLGWALGWVLGSAIGLLLTGIWYALILVRNVFRYWLTGEPPSLDW